MLEIFGALASLLYIWLEIRQKKVMWIVGGISSFVYVIVFANNLLFASMGIQIFYVLMSIYGWIKWSNESPEKEEGITRKMNKEILLKSGIFTLLIFILLSLILTNFSKDPYPVFDAFIASLSIIATFWLSKKYIAQWYVWIVVNMLSAILYWHMGLYPTLFLYIVYSSASIVGYLKWRNFSRVLN